MSCVNVQNIFGFLVLFSLFQTVKTNCEDAKGQILQNSLNETVSSDVNTTALTSSPVDAEELNKPSMIHFISNESLDTTSCRAEASQIRPQRKPRNLLNSTNYGIKCHSCVNDLSSKNWNCFKGIS